MDIVTFGTNEVRTFYSPKFLAHIKKIDGDFEELILQRTDIITSTVTVLPVESEDIKRLKHTAFLTTKIQTPRNLNRNWGHLEIFLRLI